jgi:hypothetical protein
MAAFHGKSGKVTFAAGAVANLTGWTLDATAEVADGTVMTASACTSSTHWRDYAIGFKQWTATCEANLDDGGIDPDLATDLVDADGAALILYEGMQASSVRKYSGTAFLTGVSVSVDKDDVEKVTYSFQGSDTLSVAASDLV